MTSRIRTDIEALARLLAPQWTPRIEALLASGVPTALEDGEDEGGEAAGPAFRTVEEYEARQTSIEDLLRQLDQEYAGQIMPDETKGRWNSLNEELEENRGIIVELRQRAERLRQLEATAGAQERQSFETAAPRRVSNIYDVWAIRQAARGPEDESRMLRDNAMKAVEQARFAHPDVDQDEAKAHVEKLFQRFAHLDEESVMVGGESHLANFARQILVTGQPIYKRAFGKSLMGRALTPEEQRALSTGTTTGGFAVPFSLDPTVVPVSNSSVNPYRAISRVEQIATTTWQGVTSTGVTATRRSEAAQTADGAPSLLQPTATPSRVDAFVPYSIEVGMDWGSLESEMASLIQDAKDDEEAAAFSTGNGVAPNPQGILSGATTLVTGAGTGTFALADVYSVYNALPPRFKPRAAWVANEAIYNLTRQFDTAGGAGLWIENLQLPTGGLQGQVPSGGSLMRRLLGRAAYEASAYTGSVASAGKIMTLGDWRYFLIVDRIGMTVELIPHLFGTTQMPTGQRGLFAYWRNTSVVLAPNAFRTLIVR